MKIIIDHGRVRREIEGSFNLIGNPYELRDVAKQILLQVGEHDDVPFSYGTVYITEKFVGVPNQPVRGWED